MGLVSRLCSKLNGSQAITSGCHVCHVVETIDLLLAELANLNGPIKDIEESSTSNTHVLLVEPLTASSDLATFCGQQQHWLSPQTLMPVAQCGLQRVCVANLSEEMWFGSVDGSTILEMDFSEPVRDPAFLYPMPGDAIDHLLAIFVHTRPSKEEILQAAFNNLVQYLLATPKHDVQVLVVAGQLKECFTPASSSAWLPVQA
ncbi:hypothetical protein C8Q73DRAFT_664336 [Cubamyces lactineus]|nr:hypothetical protein C8Q73DRAFT_664336 [Cubamyces lactineus]